MARKSLPAASLPDNFNGKTTIATFPLGLRAQAQVAGYRATNDGPWRAGDCSTHAHALCGRRCALASTGYVLIVAEPRGLRHLAVRRGVAVGGDRDLIPAAAGRARSRPVDAVADTRAVRSA